MKCDYFVTLFNGNWQEERYRNGAIFVDRDGNAFSMLLQFLRDEVVVLPEDAITLEKLKKAADFFQYVRLCVLIENEMTERQKILDKEESLQNSEEQYFDLYFYSRIFINYQEKRTVSGKQIRLLQNAGFQPMFNLMKFNSADNSFRMPAPTELVSYAHIDSSWLLLVDTFLYGTSKRVGSKYWLNVWLLDVDEKALKLAKENRITSVVIEKLLERKLDAHEIK